MATSSGLTFWRCILPSSSLMIQAVRSFETPVHLEAARHHVPGGLYIQELTIREMLPIEHFRMFCLHACYLRRVWNKIIFSRIVYECKTWSLTLREEHIERRFENRVLENVVVKRLTLLRIRKVPGLNLGQETGYNERFFMGFLSPFLIHNSLITLLFDAT
jgi:hypothetical protein